MHTHSPTVIGRTGELRELDTAAAQGRDHQGAVVFVVGDPGMGKSRLVNQAAEQVRSHGVVLQGRCSSIGAPITLRPVAEALLSLDRASAVPQNPELRPYRTALSALVPQWRERTGPSRPESLIVLAEAVLRLLAAAGRDQGCLLILEDLHDADPESIAVTEYLVDNLRGLPVTLFVTLRPNDGPALDLAYQSRSRKAGHVIELRPLTADGVTHLAASCLGISVDELPAPVARRLLHDADGTPLIVEELLNGMIATGALQQFGAGDWRVVRNLDTTVPVTLTRSVLTRADRLGPQGKRALNTAALLGRHFSSPLLQTVTGLDNRSLHIHLRSAVDAQLILPEHGHGDAYVFKHALTVEALLTQLLPGERAQLARSAAEALEKAEADLPGKRLELAAGLWHAAGELHRAGLLLAEAGHLALREGLVANAAHLLERSLEFIEPHRDQNTWADCVESLLNALVESGAIERAFEFARSVADTALMKLDDARRANLHAQLAWTAVMVGRWPEAAERVAAARSVLGSDCTPEQRVPVDVVDGFVQVRGGRKAPGLDTTQAETLVRDAVESAERIGLPVIACQGLQLLALLARPRGFDEADACLRRILAIADKHGLGLWRARALSRLATNQGMVTGSPDQLEQVHRVFLQMGAIASAYQAESALAMHAVLRGEGQRAEETLSRCSSALIRLGHTGDLHYVYVVQATLAAHQGRPRDMERHLADYRDGGGEHSEYTPVVLGLCHAVSALLDEDRPAARDALAAARAWDLEHPATYFLTGCYGLELLVAAVSADLDQDRLEAVARKAPARLRWNLQFVHFTRAVLLGGDSRHDEATEAVEQAILASAPFPLARHLGLRLVSEAAITDGWGTPGLWLRTAEEYFHDANIAPVASACRALLRQAGMPATQRRSGHGRVPEALRRHGITAREYDVLVLLARRYGNNEIAERLFISPRTAEKHVASLMAKTDSPGRRALCEFAHRTASPDRKAG
ncbi:ATP-binding protein [Streptomyces sp. NPDC020951]|uniref:ATP-binding protein n=1 Tax=Streptomyces sp. NPDC020951 TaxID=3365104 RepID=UPI0037BCF3C1